MRFCASPNKKHAELSWHHVKKKFWSHHVPDFTKMSQFGPVRTCPGRQVPPESDSFYSLSRKYASPFPMKFDFLKQFYDILIKMVPVGQDKLITMDVSARFKIWSHSSPVNNNFARSGISKLHRKVHVQKACTNLPGLSMGLGYRAHEGIIDRRCRKRLWLFDRSWWSSRFLICGNNFFESSTYGVLVSEEYRGRRPIEGCGVNMLSGYQEWTAYSWVSQ